MLLVVAATGDREATTLPNRWAPREVGVLTPSDLSRPGWQYRPDDPTGSIAIVDGQAVPAREIAGVIVRLSRVPEVELTGIAPTDRAYAAAEMTAFLASWLATLPCPVLNRPAPPLLTSPCWRPERWVLEAQALGIPAASIRRWSRLRDSSLGVDSGRLTRSSHVGYLTITVVGDRCLGRADNALCDQARRLANAAGVELLAVRFSSAATGSRFVAAHPWVDLTDPNVADALLQHFDSRSRDAQLAGR